MAKTLADAEGFEWDDANSGKNWHLHQVSDAECEEIFFNSPLIVAFDKEHSQNERRYFALGFTDAGRKLFAVFTMRRNLIRIISARDMTNSEERRYEEKSKRDADL